MCAQSSPSYHSFIVRKNKVNLTQKVQNFDSIKDKQSVYVYISLCVYKSMCIQVYVYISQWVYKALLTRSHWEHGKIESYKHYTEITHKSKSLHILSK